VFGGHFCTETLVAERGEVKKKSHIAVALFIDMSLRV